MARGVALFTRAWIEMRSARTARTMAPVALFTRAWIEIATTSSCSEAGRVALFTRAWIEIRKTARSLAGGMGRPLHEGVD